MENIERGMEDSEGNTADSTVNKEEQDDKTGTRLMKRAGEVRTMIR